MYMSLGVGRLYVAYPYLGAMLEPVVWDKRARDILPRLFCFHYFLRVPESGRSIFLNS